MEFGTLKTQENKAYWVQIWKVRFGVFVSPVHVLFDCGFDKFLDKGWQMSFGPFQICYYRYAKKEMLWKKNILKSLTKIWKWHQ